MRRMVYLVEGGATICQSVFGGLEVIVHDMVDGFELESATFEHDAWPSGRYLALQPLLQTLISLQTSL